MNTSLWDAVFVVGIFFLILWLVFGSTGGGRRR